MIEEDIKKRQIICMEGPDASGKSTQVNLLASKLKNCIVIHSPRTCNNTTKCFELTLKTIYNKEFMNSITDPYNLNKEKYLELFDALKENILINLMDRKDVCDTINELYTTQTKKFDIHNTKDYVTYYDGNIISLNDERIDKLYELFIKDPKSVYIILDRFTVSGYVYNVYIPVRVLKDYKNKVEGIIAELDNEKNPQYTSESKTEIINNCGYIIHILSDLIELLKKLNEIYTMTYNLLDLEKLFNIVIVYFKKSEILRGIASKTRENDAYDNENIIQKYADEYYSKFYDPYTLVDTDNLINTKSVNNADDIANYISAIVHTRLD